MRIKLFTIPNLLTLSNLLCGALGAVAALSRGNLTAAFGFMAAAAVFDFFDGFAARLLRQEGPIGGELDSLADDISFGFLPAAVLYVLYGRSTGGLLPEWAGFLVFVFAACAALRLAKFNIDDSQHTEFCGLPSPAAALFCASLGLLAERYGLEVSREAVVLAAWSVGALMVSPVRMFALKFSHYGWKGNEIRYSFLAVSAVLLAVLQLRAIPVVVALYVFVSLVRWAACRTHSES
ncbi:MAG TPA: CDP-alcohol phosphatidyltransferase family protein [Alistipes sp.]|uniref:CDP-alcohol phosphatidyltransferase family protein n=1 Tax=unclassified Alistipes TaxID=2608932 RepID=UPI00258B4115|nr:MULTISPECIES: CDP-alcohol phosphatidyltransferase family protein [unclassified Alistipes]HUN14626.1 CDP-alcohol phosphatidyltransferase family protein [Alistipes sp.]